MGFKHDQMTLEWVILFVGRFECLWEEISTGNSIWDALVNMPCKHHCHISLNFIHSACVVQKGHTLSWCKCSRSVSVYTNDNVMPKTLWIIHEAFLRKHQKQQRINGKPDDMCWYFLSDLNMLWAGSHFGSSFTVQILRTVKQPGVIVWNNF